MKNKVLWATFMVAFLVLVPSKIFFSFTGSVLERSVFFFFLNMVFLVGFWVLNFISKDYLQEFKIKFNPYLGISSLALSVLLFFYSFSLIPSTPSPNKFLVSFLSIILSFLSGVGFIPISLSYFMGKNKVKPAPILIFSPVFLIVVKMVSFLSMTHATPSLYIVCFYSFVVLFLCYQIQLFVKTDDRNVSKNLFAFGFPAIITSFMVGIHEAYLQIQNFNDLSALLEPILFIVLGVYILLTLIEIQNQMDLRKNDF